MIDNDETTDKMKAECMGEHKLIIESVCPLCADSDIDPDCDYCGGQYEFEVAYVIPWDIQKDIYRKMVNCRLKEIKLLGCKE